MNCTDQQKHKTERDYTNEALALLNQFKPVMSLYMNSNPQRAPANGLQSQPTTVREEVL